ncbi:MAG: RDD family protein [Acidobacteriota bacterium]|nr:RDD family protein [Acidobacteriota bacterium]
MTARIDTPSLLSTDVAVGREQAQTLVERLRAPFSLRCGALLIDYILLAGIIAFSTLVARMGNRPRASASSAEMIGILIAVIVALLNFIGLPALRGQTLGKWATGLVIRRRDGEPLRWWRALLRQTLLYPPFFLMLGLVSLLAEVVTGALILTGAFILLLGLGFLVASFSENARALHDIIAGTVVMRDDVRRRRPLR